MCERTHHPCERQHESGCCDLHDNLRWLKRATDRAGNCSWIGRYQARPNKNARGNSIPRAFSIWWGKKDSNLRSHTAADLQSAPFATRDTPPLNVVGPSHPNRAAGRPWMTVKSEPEVGRPVGAFMGEAVG